MRKKLKNISKLKQKKYRVKEDKFLLEGIRNIEEILRSDVRIDSILYTDQLLKTKRGLELYLAIEKKKIKADKIAEEDFKNISNITTSQGILAICQKPNYNFSKLMSSKIKSLVILDGIQDPGNLGTIIRTADAAGVSGIITGEGTVDIYNPKVLNSAMGSFLHIPVVKVDDLAAAVKKLKEQGIRILVCDVRGEKNYSTANYNYPVGVIFGNEGAGPKKELINLADEVIKIPIVGRAESLNVGIACGIVLYKMLEE
jgi:RNA methyltransferase, TrmH family